MTSHVRGTVARQAHVAVPEGTFEEEIARDGFFGRASHLYRRHAPVGWTRIEGALRPRAYQASELGLPDEKVVNNIQRYGNTTAGSIPIALNEAREDGRLKRGGLVCIAAFGAGFTWGAALLTW